MPKVERGEKLTPFQQHIRKWQGCEACDLCHRRKRVVFYRGKIPCDFLFVGEAPGVNENTTGLPFVGPAGDKLNEIVTDVMGAVNEYREGRGLRPATVGFTNLLGCIPLEEDSRTKVSSPPKEAVKACSPRLAEIIKIANPILIICCGKDPEKYLTPGLKQSIKIPKDCAVCKIDHPAYILRKSAVEQGYLIRKALVTVVDAVEQLGDFK